MRDELSDVEHQYRQLQSEVAQAVGELPSHVNTLQARLARIQLTLRRVQEGIVDMEPEECLYWAVEAEWKKTDRARENPDGILVVTDRRLVMERREKEGSFLGIGGRKVQEICWSIPWVQVGQIRAEKRGLFGGVDLIHVDLKPNAPLGVESVCVEIKGHIDAHDFVGELLKVLEGRLENERVPLVS